MALQEQSGARTILGNIKQNWKTTRHRLSTFSIFFLLLCLVLGAYFFNRIFINIYPGHSGVLWKRFHGGTDMQFVYNEGLHIIPPWDKMYIYDIRIQQLPFSFEALSKDGLPITFEVTVRYRPERLNLPFLHKTVGPDYLEKVVKPEVQAHVRKVVANYLPEEIYTSEGYLLQIIMQGAMVAINEKYIVLDNLLIRRMVLPKIIVEAIEKKLAQQQYVLELDYRLQSEAKEARRKAIEAEGIKRFQDIVKTGGFFDKFLQYKGIEATVSLAKSDNAKVVVVGGGGSGGLPLIMNMDGGKEKNSTSAPPASPPPQMSESPNSGTATAPAPATNASQTEPAATEPEMTFFSRLKQYLVSEEQEKQVPVPEKLSSTASKDKAP